MRVRQGQWSKLNDDAEVLWDAYRRDPCQENRNLLAVHYHPFVRYVAVGCWNKLTRDIQTDLDDLTSSASMALLDVIARFDSGRGTAFTTFAGLRLQGACIDHIREMDWVPRLERLAAKKGEVIPVGIGSIDVDRGFSADSDANSDVDSGGSLLLVIENKAESESSRSRSNREFFEDACKSCNAKERAILIAYYQDDLTMKEIGAALGISESRISQCHSAIIRRLKEDWSKHGKPSDRQPQSGGRGARAHLEDVRGMQPTQGRDGEGAGDQPAMPVCEADPVRTAKRRNAKPKGIGPGGQDRGVPAKPRRKVERPVNRKANQRVGQKGRGLPAKRKPVRATGTRAVVPGNKGAK